MNNRRLPAGLEATAIIRRINAEGGFAAVLAKGDPDRGALVLIIRTRGEFVAVLEREMSADFEYRWVQSRSAEQLDEESLASFLAKKRQFDADSWLIELNIAQPERFIAETISSA